MATVAKQDADVYARGLLRSVGLDVLAGIWLFASAFLLSHDQVSFINNVTCGGVVVILAFGPFAHAFLAWLPVAIGGWVAVAPFVLGFADDAAVMWNNVLTGALMLIIAARSQILTKAAHDAGVLPD
jgi:hypothetical protein